MEKNSLIQKEIYLPVADNSESPYSVYSLQDLSLGNDFVTAVERRTDMIVMTEEDYIKIINKAINLGRKREKSGVTSKVDVFKI